MRYNYQRASLQQLGREMVKALKKNAPVNSGDLKKSIKAIVDDNELEIEMLTYGSFIDKGINGIKKKQGSVYSFSKKRPPISALKKWAKKKKINVWALQRSIFENGIKGTNFINKSTESKLEDFSGVFAQAVIDDFMESINKTLQQKK